MDHVVGIADGQNSSIYKNGVFKQNQSYAGIVATQRGAAPVRMATRDQQFLSRRSVESGLEPGAHRSGSPNGVY